MDLQRRDGESKFDYHKRLVYGKLVDKTLADADYSEIAECIYGKPYSSDVARRMLYGSRQTIDAIDGEKLSIAKKDHATDIDLKILELQKERQRLSDQRREYNKGVTADARFEHICDRLVEAASGLRELDGVFAEATDIDFQDNDAVLVMCDWHFGMVTDNIYNRYDTNICIKRVEEIVSMAVERIRLHKCRRLHVVVLGDLLHGNPHITARIASEEIASDQLMKVAEILAQAIYHLSSFVEETNVYITYGNHARLVPNKKESIHRDSLERLLPWWLEWRLKSREDIHIVDCDENEFIFMDIYGHQICATHGDLDTVRSAPSTLPVVLRKKRGMDIEYIILADKHHRESFDSSGVSAILCGSLCGPDDFANEHRLYSDPQQLLLIVNERCGVDAEYRLKCNT